VESILQFSSNRVFRDPPTCAHTFAHTRHTHRHNIFFHTLLSKNLDSIRILKHCAYLQVHSEIRLLRAPVHHCFGYVERVTHHVAGSVTCTIWLEIKVQSIPCSLHDFLANTRICFFLLRIRLRLSMLTRLGAWASSGRSESAKTAVRENGDTAPPVPPTYVYPFSLCWMHMPFSQRLMPFFFNQIHTLPSALYKMGMSTACWVDMFFCFLEFFLQIMLTFLVF
jgi:hypothetical protein